MPAVAYASEATVLISTLQQITSQDLTAISTIGQGTQDSVVSAFLEDGLAYKDMAVTQNSDGQGVTVGPGIIFSTGGGYRLRAAANQDLAPLINALPDTVQSQVVLIVASCDTVPTGEGRTLEDASKQPTNPADLWPTVEQQVNTRVVRAATPTILPGVIAVAPNAPGYNPLLCLLATVVINKTVGVVSVQQNTALQITRLDQLAAVVDTLGATVSGFSAALQNATADIAALKASVASLGTLLQSEITALQQQVVALGNKQATQQTGSIYTVTDFYTDATGLMVQAGNQTYTVGSGLTFPAAVNGSALAPLNQNSADYQVSGGKLTRAYVEGGRALGTPGGGGGGWGANSLASAPAIFQFNTGSPISSPVSMKGFGIQRTRYGAAFGAQSVAQLLGSGDPTQIFSPNPANLNYLPAWDDWREDNPILSHTSGLWNDLTSQGYWTPQTPAAPIVNTPAIMQPMVAPSTFFAGSVYLSVAFGPSGNTGNNPIRLLICDDAGNAPDFSRCIADLTVQPQNGENTDAYGTTPVTKFVLPYPILITGGVRTWFCFVSNSDCKVFMNVVTPGAAYQSQYQGLPAIAKGPGGAYAQVNASYPVVSMDVFACAFHNAASQPSIDVPLQALYQGGGIDQVDIAIPAIIPPGSKVTYGLYDAQQRFQEFATLPLNGVSLLAGRPSTLPLVLRITGAAVIDLGNTQQVTAQANTAKQAATLSAARLFTPPAPVKTITRSVTLVGFNPALHTYAEQLGTGNGFATLTPPTTSTAPALQPDGSYLVAFSWVLAAAVASFQVLMSGVTTDSTVIFREPQAVTTATP